MIFIKKGNQMRKPILFIIAALALFALACGERNAIPEKDSAKQKGESASVTEPPSLEPIDYDYYCDDSAYRISASGQRL